VIHGAHQQWCGNERAGLGVVSQTLQQRVQQRQGRGQDPSEADVAVLQRQLQFDEPLSADEQVGAIVCRTDDPALDIAALAARWQAAPR